MGSWPRRSPPIRHRTSSPACAGDWPTRRSLSLVHSHSLRRQRSCRCRDRLHRGDARTQAGNRAASVRVAAPGRSTAVGMAAPVHRAVAPADRRTARPVRNRPNAEPTIAASDDVLIPAAEQQALRRLLERPPTTVLRFAQSDRTSLLPWPPSPSRLSLSIPCRPSWKKEGTSDAKNVRARSVRRNGRDMWTRNGDCPRADGERAANNRAAESTAPPSSRVPLVVALKLQVVLSKYQGDKKVSAMPYMLSLATSRTASVCEWAERSLSLRPLETSPVTSFNYRSVGTASIVPPRPWTAAATV